MSPAYTRSRDISPVSITAKDFPTPQGQVFSVTKRDRGLVSPTQSTFPFTAEDEAHAIPTPRETMEEKALTRTMERGSPGDGAKTATAIGTPQQQDLRKKKSQFYTEVFSYREPNLSPKERVYKDSVITAEVRTNVIVRLCPV